MPSKYTPQEIPRLVLQDRRGHRLDRRRAGKLFRQQRRAAVHGPVDLVQRGDELTQLPVRDAGRGDGQRRQPRR